MQLSYCWPYGRQPLPGALARLGMVGQVFLGDVHITTFFWLQLEGAGQYHHVDILCRYQFGLWTLSAGVNVLY